MAPLPFVLSSMFSFWILHYEPAHGDVSSLNRVDKIFKQMFPETNTPRPAQAQRSQHPDQISAPPTNKSKAEKAGNYIRDYVVSPARPHASQLQKVSPSHELNTTPIPETDEDALYEQAFNELQGGERVVATWSRAFAEAEGEEEKAKALYISARVATLSWELLEKFEADRVEGERLKEAERKAKAERKAEEEVEADWIQEKKGGIDRFAAGAGLATIIVGLTLVVFIADRTSSPNSTGGIWFPTDKPNCLVWNHRPNQEESATWSGDCLNGKAHGVGKLTWLFLKDGRLQEAYYEGKMLKGRGNGRGTYKYEHGDTYSGDYKDGSREGQGTYTSGDGTWTQKGLWKNNKFLGATTYNSGHPLHRE